MGGYLTINLSNLHAPHRVIGNVVLNGTYIVLFIIFLLESAFFGGDILYNKIRRYIY